MHPEETKSLSGDFERVSGFKHFIDTGAVEWNDKALEFIAANVGTLQLHIHFTWMYTQYQKIVQVMLQKDGLAPILVCENVTSGTNQVMNICIPLEANDKIYIRARREVSNVVVHMDSNENTTLRSDKSVWVSGQYTVGY